MEKKEEIISNKIKCKKCGDVIESKNTNDYKRCSCGAVAVDGGKDYLKRIGNEKDYEEISITKKCKYKNQNIIKNSIKVLTNKINNIIHKSCNNSHNSITYKFFDFFHIQNPPILMKRALIPSPAFLNGA